MPVCAGGRTEAPAQNRHALASTPLGEVCTWQHLPSAIQLSYKCPSAAAIIKRCMCQGCSLASAEGRLLGVQTLKGNVQKQILARVPGSLCSLRNCFVLSRGWTSLLQKNPLLLLPLLIAWILMISHREGGGTYHGIAWGVSTILDSFCGGARLMT